MLPDNALDLLGANRQFPARGTLDGRGCPIDTAPSANWIDGGGRRTQHFQQNRGTDVSAEAASVEEFVGFGLALGSSCCTSDHLE